MKVCYNQRHLQIYLKLGILFLVMPLLRIGSEPTEILGLVWLFLGLLCFSHYAYCKKRAYLTITKEYLRINFLFAKKMLLADVQTIRKITGKYILFTDHGRLTIDIHIMDKDSLEELEGVLGQLTLKKPIEEVQ